MKVNEELASKNNQVIAQKICKRFSYYLDDATLKSCGDMAIWRCTKKHGNCKKLSSYVMWECLNAYDEEKKMRKTSVKLPNDLEGHFNSCDISMILNEYLDRLTKNEKKIIISRFLEKNPVREIAKKHKYSRTKVYSIIKKSLIKMRKNGV